MNKLCKFEQISNKLCSFITLGRIYPNINCIKCSKWKDTFILIKNVMVLIIYFSLILLSNDFIFICKKQILKR